MNTSNLCLKILHVLDHSLPLHSGYAFRSQDILRAQRQRGWEPVALTSSKHMENWRGEWSKAEIVNGFEYHRVKPLAHAMFPLALELRRMKALARRLHEVALAEKPDLLHAHSPVLNAFPALWVGRRLELPVVYEIRAFWEDAAADHGTYRQNSWQYRLVRSLETWVCHHMDGVAVLCCGIKDDLVHRGIPPENLTIVANGVNPADFKPVEPEPELQETWGLVGRKVIGFVGSFYRYEGLDLLLESFAQLAAARSDVALLLVGAGEVETELKLKVKELRLDDRVVMPGRIPHERIPGIYALIDVLAYPRYNTRLTETVTPLKPLEAMAMGKALVASDIGGHQELIAHGQTGLLFPPGDASALANVLGTLLDDLLLREHLQRQGPVWVRRERTWDKTTQAYSDLYAKVMAQKGKIGRLKSAAGAA